MSLSIEERKELDFKKSLCFCRLHQFSSHSETRRVGCFPPFLSWFSFFRCRFCLKLTHLAHSPLFHFHCCSHFFCPLLAATVRRSLGSRGRGGLRFWASCSSEYGVTRTSTKTPGLVLPFFLQLVCFSLSTQPHKHTTC